MISRPTFEKLDRINNELRDVLYDNQTGDFVEHTLYFVVRAMNKMLRQLEEHFK